MQVGTQYGHLARHLGPHKIKPPVPAIKTIMTKYVAMVGCLKCQSSSSAKYSVKDLAGYQLVCQSYGQTWKQINFPNQTTTISASTTATATSSMAGGGGAVVPTSVDGNPSSGNKSTSGSGNSSLSSGAIAGIVVSVIALIVALSVAGYVWGRRRRDSVRHTDLDEYKYRDTQPDSYMEVALPQYTGMIQPTLPPISKVSNLRVMNPDSDEDEEMIHAGGLHRQQSQQQSQQSFEVRRTSSPGWRRGSFDDD
ncbi:hypothetical protein EDD11_000322 [Mortierella claussenii]|nr:hypothetical protein EDD11_000322 [Mortierella claussenii]